MIEIKVQIDAVLPEQLVKVEDLDKAFRDGGFSQQVGQAILADGIRPYPAPTGGSYVRTYKLFNSWQLILPSGGGVLFIVQSSGVDYADLVQQQATQAWMHRNRWQTVESVAETRERFVADEATKFIEGLFR